MSVKQFEFSYIPRIFLYSTYAIKKERNIEADYS